MRTLRILWLVGTVMLFAVAAGSGNEAKVFQNGDAGNGTTAIKLGKDSINLNTLPDGSVELRNLPGGHPCDQLPMDALAAAMARAARTAAARRARAASRPCTN